MCHRPKQIGAEIGIKVSAIDFDVRAVSRPSEEIDDFHIAGQRSKTARTQNFNSRQLQGAKFRFENSF